MVIVYLELDRFLSWLLLLNLLFLRSSHRDRLLLLKHFRLWDVVNLEVLVGNLLVEWPDLLFVEYLKLGQSNDQLVPEPDR